MIPNLYYFYNDWFAPNFMDVIRFYSQHKFVVKRCKKKRRKYGKR